MNSRTKVPIQMCSTPFRTHLNCHPGANDAPTVLEFVYLSWICKGSNLCPFRSVDIAALEANGNAKQQQLIERVP